MTQREEELSSEEGPEENLDADEVAAQATELDHFVKSIQIQYIQPYKTTHCLSDFRQSPIHCKPRHS
jgi:hypothetical protein